MKNMFNLFNINTHCKSKLNLNKSKLKATLKMTRIGLDYWN